jgi:hypothetical protein
MKYISRLSDEELTELYKMFMGECAEIVSLEITRFDDSICLDGYIKIPDDGEGAEGGMIEVDDNYEITDYNVRVYCHSGSLTIAFREYMYEKFGDEYAKDFLFSQ